MNDSFLSSFTPSLMSPATLEAIFVQKHKLVSDLIESVEDSAATANKHFRLLIGMRGIGKTHIIALIYHRLKATEDLQNKLLIAWLKEEEWGVSSWLDLLLRIFQALKIEYPALYQDTLQVEVESLYELSVEDATRQGEKILKEFIADRTLLLLTENLDEIFNGLSNLGQKQFRAYLQNHNLITIIATSQSLFAGVSQKDSPFYGFFAPQYLDKLTIKEATALLAKIAQLQQDQELASFIQSTTGKERIKAIHHLAGGNHRVYIIFSQFLTRNSLDELVKPVMQTLDELTPYYQARMQWLSPQQRKIIELLCDKGNALPVKEIAQRCFITHQTASSQLKDLRTKGYVTAEAVGRASFYELQEPLMRICLEVKKQRGEPIKLFIDFLRIWYSADELKARLELLPENCLERKYIARALAVKESFVAADLDQHSRDTNDLVNQGVEAGKAGDIKKALELFERAIEIDPNDDETWFNRGVALGELGRLEEELASYDRAIEIKPDYDSAWFNRGNALFYLGGLEEALASYERTVEIDPNDDETWYNRGVALGELGRLEEALASYDRAIEIKPNYDSAWYNRGNTLAHLGRLEEALASYERTVEIDPNDDETWYNRGVALGELGRLEEALASYDRAIEIKPDYDSAWYNRGNTLFDLGRLEEALASYEGAIEINPGDDRAWFNRIEVIFKQNNWDKGFKDLDIGLNHFAKGEEFYPGDIAAYLQIIWDSTTDIKVWQSRLQTLVAIYDKHQVVSTVGKGIVAHIPNLMSDLVSDKLARAWLEIWQEIAEDKSELTIALRLLKTAVEYKEKKGDRKILLRLAKEEREILEPLIKKQ